MKILVYIDQRSGKIKSSSLEALTLGSELSGKSPANVAAVVVGKGVGALNTQLQGYGCDTVYVADDASLENYNCLNYAAAVEQAIKDFNPDLILGTATPMGRDLFPRLAARFDAGIVSDATGLKAEGDKLVATKPMYSGKVLAKLELPAGGKRFVSVRPNVFQANKSNAGSATAKALSAKGDSAQLTTVEIRKGKSEKPDLTEAGVIVSGGRSLGSADNFKILFEMGEVLGATVGASRAAVDSGYATHDMQVGQTGKTVNPNLYIAAGISGSIQHMAGMRTSKYIVAINTDREAPIFTVADYGIVGDLFQVVPAMTKKLKEMLEH